MKKKMDKTEVLLYLIITAVLVILITLLSVQIKAMAKPLPFVIDERPLTEEEMKARIPAPKEKEVIREVIITKQEVAIDYPIFEEISLDAKYQIKAQELCHEYKVAYGFFLAMCESESSFREEAEGDSGHSIGLMQINEMNWNRYGLDASIPYDNLEIGIRMMAELIEKYGDFDMVVMSYKGGESKAKKWKEEGFRLQACDELINRTMYYSNLIQ